MYKLFKLPASEIGGVIRLSDGACIPFAPANTDYQQFRVEVANGAELQDAEGVVMTQAQVDEFLKTIPE